MKEQIKLMKQELKELARQIKENKKKRSKENNGFIPGLNEQRVEFRHKHVAYCLVRGRLLEQVDSGKGLNMDHVNWIIASMQPDSKEKLYVVVSNKLSPAQQAVQSCHAVAQFMKEHPHTQWSNGHIVLLTDTPRYNGDMYDYARYSPFADYSEFKEPDLGNKTTAFAVFGSDCQKRFKSLVLL